MRVGAQIVLVYAMLLTVASALTPVRLFSRRLMVTAKGTARDASVTQPGHVYFVATPIGNLKDITTRARDVLSHADVLCAEDSRHTISLLRHLEIGDKRIISHHEHNHEKSIPGIVSLAKSGKSIAVVSDAGTPGVSDPGAELAAALSEEGIPLHPIPGCSAMAAALSISGFPATPFTFYGFLPAKGKARTAVLEQIAATTHTLVLYEAPHRIERTLRDLVQHSDHSANSGVSAPVGGKKSRRAQPAGPVSSMAGTSGMGNRRAVCCRELTKMHEQISRGTLAQLLQALQTEAAAVGPVSTSSSSHVPEAKSSSTGGGSVGAGSPPEPGDDEAEEGYQGEAINIRGEFTLVIGPAGSGKEGDQASIKAGQGHALEEALRQMQRDGVRRSEAVGLCVDMLGLSKSAVYAKALSIPDW